MIWAIMKYTKNCRLSYFVVGLVKTVQRHCAQHLVYMPLRFIKNKLSKVIKLFKKEETTVTTKTSNGIYTVLAAVNNPPLYIESKLSPLNYWLCIVAIFISSISLLIRSPSVRDFLSFSHAQDSQQLKLESKSLKQQLQSKEENLSRTVLYDSCHNMQIVHYE